MLPLGLFTLSGVPASSGWAGWIIRWIINPLVLLAVPITCLLVTISIVGDDWNDEDDAGLRSLAGALLPFVAAIFIFMFQANLFERIATQDGKEGFLVSMVIGLVLPFLTRIDNAFAKPVAAFCFSAAFSVLVFSYAALRDERIFVFYYGFAIGILGHLWLFGLGRSKPEQRTTASKSA